MVAALPPPLRIAIGFPRAAEPQHSEIPGPTDDCGENQTTRALNVLGSGKSIRTLMPWWLFFDHYFGEGVAVADFGEGVVIAGPLETGVP